MAEDNKNLPQCIVQDKMHPGSQGSLGTAGTPKEGIRIFTQLEWERLCITYSKHGLPQPQHSETMNSAIVTSTPFNLSDLHQQQSLHDVVCVEYSECSSGQQGIHWGLERIRSVLVHSWQWTVHLPKVRISQPHATHTQLRNEKCRPQAWRAEAKIPSKPNWGTA